MTSIVQRTVRSTPSRDAIETWRQISELLTRGEAGERCDMLDEVAGIAASLITEQSLAKAPLVATCDGPRTHIYCIHDDDAMDGSKANENALGFDPLEGDWEISLPCPASDLEWAGNALAAKTNRIKVRDEADGASVDQAKAKAENPPLVLDPARLFDS